MTTCIMRHERKENFKTSPYGKELAEGTLQSNESTSIIHAVHKSIFIA